MKRRKLLVIAGILLVLVVLAFIASALLRRPAEKAAQAPVFVERPMAAPDPATAQAAASKARLGRRGPLNRLEPPCTPPISASASAGRSDARLRKFAERPGGKQFEPSPRMCRKLRFEA